MSARSRHLPLLVGCSLALLALGCRGLTSEEPPVHLNPHMDDLPRFDPQEGSTLFADGRAMRPPVPGTVAVGQLRDDAHRFRGLYGEGFAAGLPMPVSEQLLRRGQQRYDIFCAACHDRAGSGNGMVAQKGLMPPPPSFHDDRLRAAPVGYFFAVMTRGVRSMRPYAAQIPVDDRWAIAAYLRTLQRSQDASFDMIPADVRVSKGWEP